MTGPLYCADRAEAARLRLLFTAVAVGFGTGTGFGILAAVMRGMG